MPIAIADRGDECLDVGCAHEGHGRATESAPGHPGSVAGWFCLSQRDHSIHFLAGDLEVVAHADMAGIHQLAQLGRIATAHRFGRGQRALVLADHVLRAPSCHRVESFAAGTKGSHIHIAQRGDAEKGGGHFALRPALVVGRIDQSAPRGRIEHNHNRARGQGDGLRLQTTAVDQQGVIASSGGGDHLIHDAAIHAHPFVLCALANASHVSRIPGQTADGSKGARRSQFHGGRG